MRILERARNAWEAFADRTPPMRETAAVYSPHFSKWGIKSYNPDDLLRAKGKALDLYQDMTREPRVKAALSQKKANLIKEPWAVLPADENSAEARRHADFIDWNFRHGLEGAFLNDLWEMLDALDVGFSILEKNFAIVDGGPWSGLVKLKNLKSKDPRWFDFKLDPFDNILELVLALDRDGKTNTKLDPSKFFHFPFMQRYENPYGTSDLRSAYRAFWIKDTAWKLRAIYMERFATPNLIGKYPRNAKQEEKDKLLDILKSYQQETAITIPEEMAIDTIDLSIANETEYQRAIRDLDEEISIGILGQVLTTQEGRKSGARAMGQVHQDVLDILTHHLGVVLSARISDQIIRPLIDLNFAPVNGYPRFHFQVRAARNFLQEVAGLEKLVNIGLPLAADDVYERLKLPKPRDGQKLLQPLHPKNSRSPAESFKEHETLLGPERISRPLTKAETFAEVERADEEVQSLVTGARSASRPHYERLKESISKAVERREVLDKKDFEAADAVARSINVGGLKEVVADTILTAGLLARRHVVDELRRQNHAFPRFARFQEGGFSASGGLAPEAAIRVFSGTIPMTKAEFASLTDAAKAKAFTVAGLEKSQIESQVKRLMLAAIESGWDFETFKFRLDELFVRYIEPSHAGVGRPEEKILDFHAETVFRNNISTAYNQGRMEMYRHETVGDFIPALQHSEIRDARTSEISKHVDGRIFPKNHPHWKVYTPPLHHNERGTIVGVNQFDFTTDQVSPPPTMRPATGFGG